MAIRRRHFHRRKAPRDPMWNGSLGLVSWLVRMETGRLKALNSIGAQTLNPNSMPSFGDQTKPFFNYAQVRVLANRLNLEPTPTLINYYYELMNLKFII